MERMDSDWGREEEGKERVGGKEATEGCAMCGRGRILLIENKNSYRGAL